MPNVLWASEYGNIPAPATGRPEPSTTIPSILAPGVMTISTPSRLSISSFKGPIGGTDSPAFAAVEAWGATGNLHLIGESEGYLERLRELSPLWDMYKEGIDLKSIEWAAH